MLWKYIIRVAVTIALLKRSNSSKSIFLIVYPLQSVVIVTECISDHNGTNKRN